MSHWNNLPQLRLGVYPTPFYRLENISRIYNKSIWIKRDDLCGVALGGNKVRKLEYLLAGPSPIMPCSPPPAPPVWGCAVS